MEELLTVEEVAKRLRLKPYTVRKLCRLRQLSHKKIGGKFLVSESDLDKFIEAHHSAAKDGKAKETPQ